jgi:membrane associated rhomboid family serine protease
MLLYWAALQLLGGFGGGEPGGGGVAFWAHIGGFLAGIVLVKLFARPDHLAAHRAGRWRPAGSV